MKKNILENDKTSLEIDHYSLRGVPVSRQEHGSIDEDASSE